MVGRRKLHYRLVYNHSVIQGQFPPCLKEKNPFPPRNFSHPWVPRILIPPATPPPPLPFTTTRYEVQNDVAALPYKIKSNLKKASKISTLKFF